MTRLFAKSIIAGCLVILFSGCASREDVLELVDECRFPTTGKEAPSWICPPHVDHLPNIEWAVGAANPSVASYGFRERVAVHNASLKLLAQMRIQLSAQLTRDESLQEEDKLELSKRLDKQLSIEFSNGAISGIKLNRALQDDAGHLWALVGISSGDFTLAKEKILQQVYQMPEMPGFGHVKPGLAPEPEQERNSELNQPSIPKAVR
ncbi:hypothetical protein [uncultured Shewanella sp.]|uniref:hypothetical protein n=1 Tax=uncultured Shewanella sp. TaxID=173975 RepID=UPI00262F20E3|nr:hypothetical protein [uncultured Shewanella sp.]